MIDPLKNIRNLSPSVLGNLGKLLVNRIGETGESSMLTRDILGVCFPKQTYRFSRALSLKPSKALVSDQNLVPKKPIHARIRGTWIPQEFQAQSPANILGGMGSLILHHHQAVHIPVIQPTAASLAFYHARLLSMGDLLRFETDQDLPLTQMSIGSDYVNFYLAKAQRGGGEYLETHDQPHFWAPQNKKCRGHILLGKQDGEQFYFTGFRIPLNQAIYLSPHALHSDAYLIGDYLVVYTVTDCYSTVIFKDEAHALKRLEFIEA